MKKNFSLHLYGAIIIFAGVFLFFSQQVAFNVLKITLGSTLLIGGLLSFLTALSRQRWQVQLAYHEMHAMTMLIYGVVVIVFGATLETLLYITSFLFFFYAFSEITFCIWLFNLHRKVSYKIVFVRMLLALAVGFGVVVIMFYPDLNKEIDMEGFGPLFIIIGINVLLYVPILKANELKETYA